MRHNEDGMRLLKIALTAFVVSISLGAAASSAQGAVRLHQGIGPLSLGATGTQVRAKLGKPDGIYSFRKGGKSFVVFDYLYRKTWSVTFLSQKGRYSAVEIASVSRGQRTSKGVGIGANESRIKKVYPGVRCKNVRARTVQRECTLSKGSRRTIFVIGLGPNPRHVLKIIVRRVV